MVFDIVPIIKQQKMNCQTNPETRKQIGHPSADQTNPNKITQISK